MKEYSLLDNINSPDDLKKLPESELPELCSQIRGFLIDNVSKTGGHLASNLGAVELTVAAHRVFSSPKDSIMFDVGHQSYIHKLLTGRKHSFATLRQMGGISGFLRPNESPHDCFVSGHASNSISASLGIARANKLRSSPGRVVCVIGDGALTGGMAYEAINDAGQSAEPLIIIYNDNNMAISKNVGAISKRLGSIRIKPRYFRAKAAIKGFFRRFPRGEKTIKSISDVKNRIKAAIMKESLFEIMGFRYFGPADGHDVRLIISLLSEAKELGGPVVIHLKTTKGKGYFPSERRPETYHGVPAFDVISGPETPSGVISSFSGAFGKAMCSAAHANSSVCAVTAAMGENTGLGDFAELYPGRFFDVGIAEEHAVTMSSGLASGGMIPVCVIYSTFLQRGFDQIIHDVAIGGNHVVFAVDRAGIVGADGCTHQGAFDVPYMLMVPGMQVYAPSSYDELNSALTLALNHTGPVALRYPRGTQGAYTENSFEHDAVILQTGDAATVVSYGIMINQAIEANKTLSERGTPADVIKINRLTGFDFDIIARSVSKTGRLIVVEDCVESGSLGQRIAANLAAMDLKTDITLLNLKDRFVNEGKIDELYARCAINAAAIISAVMEKADG